MPFNPPTSKAKTAKKGDATFYSLGVSYQEHPVMARVIQLTMIVGLAIVCALLIKTFLVASYYIDGKSMQPTLMNGEALFGEKVTRNYAYGDIVVLHPPKKTKESRLKYVKRLIGKSGDTVKWRNDTLYRNGKVVAEPYLAEYKVVIYNRQLKMVDNQLGVPYADDATPRYSARQGLIYYGTGQAKKPVTGQEVAANLGSFFIPLTDDFSIKLGKDQLLVCGDNRRNSYDGRTFGAITRSEIVARAFWRYAPLDRFSFDFSGLA